MSAGGIRNQQGGIRVSIEQSRSRQTPQTDFGSVMKTGMSRAGGAVMEAGKLAAPFIPGGAVVSAAISGMGALKSSAGAQSAVGANSTSVGGGAPMGGSAGASGGSANTVEALAAGGDKQAVMMQATKDMQEMNMSFNLQYLGLQQKMQSDNRQFTLLSNIMKTKHDTAKNAIANVR